MLPLVSIVVISFNAAAYVEETLTSAFNQTYEQIELIISDDGSTDDTVNRCKAWLQNHRERFKRTVLLSSEENTGTSRNANRGMAQADGSWLKIIAADDILKDDCIEQFIHFVSEKPTCKACCSSLIPFQSEMKAENIQAERNWSDSYFFAPEHSARKQFLIALFRYSIPSPTFFISRDVFQRIGGYDDSMRIIEDTALYFRVLLAGEKIYYLNKATVYYREHPSAVSKTKNPQVEEWKQQDRTLRIQHYIQPNVSGLASFLHEKLMTVFFKTDRLSKLTKQGLTRFGLMCIKLNIIR